MTYIFFKVKDIVIGVKELPKNNKMADSTLPKHGETAYN